jgi:hypothetical protein
VDDVIAIQTRVWNARIKSCIDIVHNVPNGKNIPMPFDYQSHYARFARERHHERIDEITPDSGGRGGD